MSQNDKSYSFFIVRVSIMAVDQTTDPTLDWKNQRSSIMKMKKTEIRHHGAVSVGDRGTKDRAQHTQRCERRLPV